MSEQLKPVLLSQNEEAMSEPEFISVLRTESENGHEAKIIEYNQYFFVVCDPCNFSMSKGTSHLDAANYILDNHINKSSDFYHL